MAGLFMNFLPRRTFEQMIHKSDSVALMM